MASGKILADNVEFKHSLPSAKKEDLEEILRELSEWKPERMSVDE